MAFCPYITFFFFFKFEGKNLLIYLCIRSYTSLQEIHISSKLVGKIQTVAIIYPGRQVATDSGRRESPEGVRVLECRQTCVRIRACLQSFFCPPLFYGHPRFCNPLSYVLELHSKVMKTQPKEFTLQILSVTLVFCEAGTQTGILDKQSMPEVRV